MTEHRLVPLNCGADALAALSAGLESFGPTEGAPDWLVSGVWLCTADQEFIATPSVDVLADGYVARVLTVDRPSDLVAKVDSDLPDIAGRLVAHGSDLELPRADVVPAAPARRTRWPGPSSLSILVRSTERAAATHRVACALLFSGDAGNVLLVGTDPTATLAMVFSDDPALVDAYRMGCEELSLEDYRRLVGA